MEHLTIEKKTVTCIVPVYNIERYLARCVISLLSQTYQRIVLEFIDDGSVDQSSQICDESAMSDPRIVVVHKPNGGVSSARNVGLLLATGDYIGFIDGDDTIKPEMYSTLVSLLEEHNADISICSFYNQSATTGKFDAYCKDDILCTLSQKEQLEYLLQNKLYSCSCWDRIYRRELVADVRFDEHIAHYEDLLFLYQVMKKSSKAVFTSRAFYYYYTNQGSAVNSAFSDKKMSMIDVCEYILEDAKINEPDLYPIAKQEFVRNNLMCAAFAAGSGYRNKAAIERLRKNVRKNLLFYLKQKVAAGYKIQAVSLSISWATFRFLNR